MSENTPAYKANTEAKNKFKIYKNSNQKNWIKLVNEDLKYITGNLFLDSEDIRNLAEDRDWWRKNVVEAVGQCLNRDGVLIKRER